MVAIGYARVSLDGEDLAAERDALAALGVDRGRIHVDYGLTGAGRDRPGLHDALQACVRGDTLVVTKLHRLAHSTADACAIAQDLAGRSVRLNLGGQIYDPSDSTWRVVLATLTAIADFEAELARSRTREGLKVARAQGRLRGRGPKLDAEQQVRLVDLHHNEGQSPEDLAELFGVARSTVYRILGAARRGAIASTRDG